MRDLDLHMIRNGSTGQKMVSHDGGCSLSLVEVANLDKDNDNNDVSHSSLMGWDLILIYSNKVLIKLDQLKCLP
jgi:hypothetical protein